MSEAGYVIVTIVSDDGPVHAYGPKEGGTYRTRQRALTDSNKMAKVDAWGKDPDDTRTVKRVICKVLGEGLEI